jgi:hypothetical protein
MDDCPICYDELCGAVTQMGCCNKVMHAECYVRCMVRKTECPMCRADQHFEMPEREEPVPEPDPDEEPEPEPDRTKIPITLLSMGLGIFYAYMPIAVIPSVMGIVLGGLIFK